jgi:hypothetical protein
MANTMQNSFFFYSKILKITNFDAAPAPARKIIRLPAAQAPAPQHWFILYFFIFYWTGYCHVWVNDYPPSPLTIL